MGEHQVEAGGGTLTTRIEDGVAVVEFARPDKLNAINTLMQAELIRVLDELELDPRHRAVVLTGQGRAFMAGADIADYGADDVAGFEAFQQAGAAVYRRLRESRLVVIAAVNGYALGGGLEMVLACDTVVASSTAEFGLPEIGLGLVPGGGGLSGLAQVAPQLARHLVLTGQRVDAVTAAAAGLVIEVVEPAELMSTALRLGRRVNRLSRRALELAKERLSTCGDETDALAGDIALLTDLFKSPIGREGVSAFNEKRRANFEDL
ncbi:enoyl-CoA hydratase/isomerase family protein [Propionibacteriaceae bacterium Y2011]